jgi:phospholipid N-methyltransferase
MKKLLFLLQYIVRPRTVGAILPSSKHLADKMINTIDFSNAKYIVEYGPGTGVFTQELINRRDKQTVILLIENNYEFFSSLMKKYKDEANLYVVHGSAENVDTYLEKYKIPYADYVVSGLPFASLPKNVSSTILNKTKRIIREDGKFITFQYTLFMKQHINSYFGIINVNKEYRNIPPAYILNCSNK